MPVNTVNSAKDLPWGGKAVTFDISNPPTKTDEEAGGGEHGAISPLCPIRLNQFKILFLHGLASLVQLHLYLFSGALHPSSPCATGKVAANHLYLRVTRAGTGERKRWKVTSKQHSLKAQENEREHWGKVEIENKTSSKLLNILLSF